MKPILVCMAVVLLASGVELTCCNTNNNYSVDDRFIAANITPSVFSKSPRYILQLKFGDCEVTIGQKISPAKTIGQPTIGFEYEAGSYYTFLLLGPDEPMPNNSYLSLYLMGMYVNVYGSKYGLNIKKSCEIATYIPANPPPGFGTHRFVMYAFKQKGIIDISNQELQRFQIYRFDFPLKEFVAQYNLKGPIAGTFFYTEYPLCSACVQL